MLTTETMILVLVAALMVGVTWPWFGRRLLSAEARNRRRRSRNYGRVTSRRHKPGVRLAVNLARS